MVTTKLKKWTETEKHITDKHDGNWKSSAKFPNCSITQHKH